METGIRILLLTALLAALPGCASVRDWYHHRAERRLHRLYQRLRQRGKPGNVTTVAVARELACFLWAAAVAD